MNEHKSKRINEQVNDTMANFFLQGLNNSRSMSLLMITFTFVLFLTTLPVIQSHFTVASSHVCTLMTHCPNATDSRWLEAINHTLVG